MYDYYKILGQLYHSVAVELNNKYSLRTNL